MNNLSKIRKSKGFTQKHLADIAETTQPTIQKIESGWDGCTLRSLNAIAKALDVPVWHLVSDEKSDAINVLITCYNSLSPDNQAVWDDMASAALQRNSKSSE